MGDARYAFDEEHLVCCGRFGVDFHFELAALSWLPGTQRYAAMGAFPGGMGRNQEYFAPSVEFDNGVDLMVQDMLWTPETSGGLLIALPPDAVTNFQELCPAGVVVGNVVGSNIFNIAWILGISSIIRPIIFDSAV